MEIRQLRYFVQAAKYLNFTTAAKECFIVQSAMSQQMALLEKELQVRLFERHSRSLSLTPSGEVLYREVQGILKQLDDTVEMVRNADIDKEETLHIGCHGDLIRKQFPKILHQFNQEEPNVKVSLLHDITESLLERLKEGKIDCSICIFTTEISQKDWLNYSIFYEDQVMLMLPRGHAYAQHSSCKFNKFPNEPVVLLRGGDTKDRMLHWAEMGSPMKVSCYVDSHSSIEAMVAAGYGVSLCMKSACRPHPSLYYVELEGHPTEKLCLCWNKSGKKEKLIHRLLPLLLMDPS